MPDRPGTPLEKYYAMRTQAVAKGAAFDSESAKEGVCRHFVLNGMRSDNPQLALVRQQPVESMDESPERRALLKSLDPEETAILEQAKAAASAASLRADAQQQQLDAMKAEMAALRAMNADLVSRMQSGSAPATPASKTPAVGSGQAPAGFEVVGIGVEAVSNDPASVQPLPPLEDYKQALSEEPNLTWTKAKLLTWAEGKGVPMSEELVSAGTKAEIVEHLLEHSKAAAE